MRIPLANGLLSAESACCLSTAVLAGICLPGHRRPAEQNAATKADPMMWPEPHGTCSALRAVVRCLRKPLPAPRRR